MERWPEAVHTYIEDLALFDDPVLRKMEARAKSDNFPIVGPAIGAWLYFFTRLIGAKRVFEMGSGFGYSTYYFAAALRDNGGGEVVHTVWDGELSEEAKIWLEKANLLGTCDFQVSESTLALESADPGIDLVFMDIDKEGYLDALPSIKRKLRPGGLLLVDNMLRDGNVVNDKDQSEATQVVRKLNKYLSDSSDWEYVLNPMRDGLGIAWLVG